jgi:hypothetical protein
MLDMNQMQSTEVNGMNRSKSGMQKRLIIGVLTAVSFAIPYAAKADQVVEARTTITGACGKLFSIDSNAAGMTAEERAVIVQKNLDNALIAAKHRSPDAVKVAMMNNNPVVTLDNFYIATADGNSAARNNMTQLELAQKWADSIKFCLADANAINNYLSMLTGRYAQKTTTASITINKDVAVAPRGMAFPVQLGTTLATAAAMPGDKVQAVISTDVPLGPNFTSYIPAGTVALGEVMSAAPYNTNNYAGKHALTLSFYALKTPDGKEIPIDAHIQGGVNSWRYVSVNPIAPICCGEKATRIEARDEYGNLKIIALTAGKGEIAGAWRGMPQDQQTQEGFRRLLLSDRSGLVIPAGEPMFLQLNATTSIAVNSAPEVNTSEMISSVGIGM